MPIYFRKNVSSVATNVFEIPYNPITNNDKLELTAGSPLYGLYKIEIPWTINFDGRETNSLYLSTQNKLHVDPRTEDDILEYNYRYLSLKPVGLLDDQSLFSTNAYYKITGTSPNRTLNVRHESARSERPAGVNVQEITNNPGIRSTSGMTSLYDRTIDGPVDGDYESTIDIPWQFKFVRDTGHPANQIVIKHGLPWITWRDSKSLIDLPQSTEIQRQEPLESEVWFKYGINDSWLYSEYYNGFLFIPGEGGTFILDGGITITLNNGLPNFQYYYEIQNIWYEVYGGSGNRTFVLKIQSTTLDNSFNTDNPIEFDMYFYENRKDEVEVVVDTIPANIEKTSDDVEGGFYYRDRDYTGDFTNAWQFVAPLSGIIDGPNYDNRATRFYQNNPTNPQAEFSWELTLEENNVNEAEIHIGNMFYAAVDILAEFQVNSYSYELGSNDGITAYDCDLTIGGQWLNSEIFYAQGLWYLQAPEQGWYRSRRNFPTSGPDGFCYIFDSVITNVDASQPNSATNPIVQNENVGGFLTYDENNDLFLFIVPHYGPNQPSLGDPDYTTPQVPYYTSRYTSNNWDHRDDIIYQPQAGNGSNDQASLQALSTPIHNPAGVGLFSFLSTDSFSWELNSFSPVPTRTSILVQESPIGSGTTIVTGNANSTDAQIAYNTKFDFLEFLKYDTFYNDFGNQDIIGFVGFFKMTSFHHDLDAFRASECDSYVCGWRNPTSSVNFPSQWNSKECYQCFSGQYNATTNKFEFSASNNINTRVGWGGIRQDLMLESILHDRGSNGESLFIISSRTLPIYYTKRGFDYVSNETGPTSASLRAPNIYSKLNLPSNSGKLDRIRLPNNIALSTAGNSGLIGVDYQFRSPQSVYDTYNSFGPHVEYRNIVYNNEYGYDNVNDLHDNLKSVTYDSIADLWVAVGRHQNIVTSTDAVNWKITKYQHYTFDVGPVDSGGQKVTTDLIDFPGWPSRKIFGSELLSIAYGNGNWVSGGNEKFYDGATGDDKRIIVCSTDAVAWQVRTGNYINAVDSATYGNGRYVMVGGSESEVAVPGQANILNSTDTIHWVGQTLTVAGSSFAVGRGFKAVTYGSGQFVAVGNQALVATSPNGTSWTIRTGWTDPSFPTTAGYNWLDIEYGNGYYLAASDYIPVGLQDQPRFYRSTDAIHWEMDGINANNISGYKLRFSPTRIKYGNGYWFAAHTGNGITGRNQDSENVDGIDLCLSTDTTNWQLQYTKMNGVPGYEKKGFGDPPKGMSDIAVNSNNDFVTVGYMPSSLDIFTQSATHIDADQYYLEGYTGLVISAANNKFFAVNKEVPIPSPSGDALPPQIFSCSTDAVHWVVRTTALSGQAFGSGPVTYDTDKGRYIFISERVADVCDVELQYSTDTITWELEPSTVFNFPNSYASLGDASLYGGPSNIKYVGGKLIGHGCEHSRVVPRGTYDKTGIRPFNKQSYLKATSQELDDLRVNNPKFYTYYQFSRYTPSTLSGRNAYTMELRRYDDVTISDIEQFESNFAATFTSGRPDGTLPLDVDATWTIRTVPVPSYSSHPTSNYNQEFISSLVKGDDYWIAKMDVINPTRTPTDFVGSTLESTCLWHVRTLQYSSGAYSWDLSNPNLSSGNLPAESSGHIIASTDFIHWQLRTTAHGPDTEPTDITGAYVNGADPSVIYNHHVVQAKISHGNGTYAILGQDYTEIINETFGGPSITTGALLPSRLETSTDTIHWTLRTLGMPYSTDAPSQWDVRGLEGSFGFIENDWGQGNQAFDIHYATVNDVSQWLVVAYSVGFQTGDTLGGFQSGSPFRLAASTDAIHWTARTSGPFFVGGMSQGLDGLGDYEISNDENGWVVYNQGYEDTNSLYSTDTIVWQSLSNRFIQDTLEDVERIAYVGNDIWVMGNAGNWPRGSTQITSPYENGLDGIDSDRIKYGSFSDYVNTSWNRVTIGDSPYYAINSLVTFRGAFNKDYYVITSKFGDSIAPARDSTPDSFLALDAAKAADDSGYINHLAITTDFIVWDIRTMNSGLKINENGVGYPSSVEYLTTEGGNGTKLFGHCMVGPMVEVNITSSESLDGTQSFINGLYNKEILELSTPKTENVGYEFDFSAPNLSWEEMPGVFYHDSGQWYGVDSVYYYDGNSWDQVF